MEQSGPHSSGEEVALEQTRPMLEAFCYMTPAEVMAYVEGVQGMYSKIQSARAEADAQRRSLDALSEADAEVVRTNDEIDAAMELLPRWNLSHAMAVFEAFATSEVEDARHYIAILLPEYTQASPAAGFDMWKRLIQDESPKVRREAYLLLQTELESQAKAEDGDDGHTSLGLTWRQVADLLFHYG